MNLHISRTIKNIVSICVILCIVISTSGCSGESSAKAISFSLLSNPDNLDPQTASSSSSIMVINNIFEGLYKRTLDNKFELGCAEKVEKSSDGKTYTYTLRDDVYWKYYSKDNAIEDGTVIDSKVTADDFVFAFQRLMDPKVETPYSSNYYFIKNAKDVKSGKKPMSSLGISVNNHGQLVLHVEYNTPLMEELLSSAPAMPCNREFFKLTKGRYGAKGDMILSNGPFFLNTWKNTEDAKKVKLKSNDKYYDYSKILVSSVNLVARTKSEAFELYKKNDVDTAIINYDQFSSAKISSKLSTQFQNTVVGIGFNESGKHFSNEKIRKALALALDREKLKTALNEGQIIASALVPSSVTIGSENYRETVGENACPSCDFGRAKELLKQGLEELKAKNGKTVNLNSLAILVDEDSYPVLDQILQTWQKELGVFIQVDIQSRDSYSKRLKNGEFECAIMSVSSDSDTPSSVLNKFMKDSQFNYAKANIDGYSETLNSAVTKESVSSMAKTYFEAERAVCFNGNFIPIYYQTEYFVWQNGINNIIFDQGSKQCYYRYAYKK